MLCNTFIHVPGIGPKTEERFWAAGLLSWGDLQGPLSWMPEPRLRLLREYCRFPQPGGLAEARHFAGLLPSAQLWRLFPRYRQATCYLDIETTGMAGWGEQITAICLWDGTSLRSYVQGENLEEFVEDIRNYDVVVTYNGKCFDIPVIESSFGIRLPQVHLDLRFLLHRLGYKGGLKGCEKQLGLDRGELEGVDGWFAVLLWQEYRRSGDPRARETLLAYNAEDTVNLELLMVHAYNLNLAGTPFAGSHGLELPVRQVLPYRADPCLVGRLKELMGPRLQFPPREAVKRLM